MRVSCESLKTCAHPTSIAGKIVQFPLIRIGIVILFFAPYLILHNVVLVEFYPVQEPLHSAIVAIDKIIMAVLFFLIYGLYVRVIEKRAPLEISLRKSGPEFFSGVVVSWAIISSFVFTLWMTGWYRVSSMAPLSTLAEALLVFGFGALLQVFVFRIVLLRLLEEWLGRWWALAITASMFGVIHFFNQNSTIWTSTALVLSDVMLIAAFYYTHRIWLVWGIHAGWNFFQDGLFGMPNSGLDQFPSWITPQLSGPAWFTGGAFGIEASVIVVLMNLIVGLYILRLASKHRLHPSSVVTGNRGTVTGIRRHQDDQFLLDK